MSNIHALTLRVNPIESLKYVYTLNLDGSNTYVVARYSSGVYALAVASIGTNIKKARQAAGIKTQGELAKKLGVPQPQLSDWENDRYGTVDMKTLMKIAATIPCAFDALVQGVDAQYDESRDLLGQGREVQKDSHPLKGESDDPASDRTRQLEDRLKEFERLVPQLEEISGQLVSLAAARAEGDEAPRKKAKGGGRRRKAS